VAHLNLWKQNLGIVPEAVWERQDLETLVLADNGLREVSERLGGLRSLRMLDLGHNALASLPEAIGASKASRTSSTCTTTACRCCRGRCHA
jgi:Leucine-rich repeat (LRR) protein